MFALDAVRMAIVVIGLVSLLAWAIVSDRRSRRTAGGKVSPADAPLHRNLEMPRELRAHSGRTHAPRTRRSPRSSLA